MFSEHVVLRYRTIKMVYTQALFSGEGGIERQKWIGKGVMTSFVYKKWELTAPFRALLLDCGNSFFLLLATMRLLPQAKCTEAVTDVMLVVPGTGIQGTHSFDIM